MKYKIASPQSVQNILFVIPLLLVVILFYAWLSSSGSGTQPGTTTYYYSSLAEGFLNGNLYLPVEPDPRLLATDNPYDLSARIALEKIGVITPVDYSLYNGKFYIYWGPVPALLLATVQLFVGQQPIGDFFLAFAFGVGIFLAQSLLLLTVWNRYFPVLPKGTLYLSLLLAGLIWPVALLRHESDHARIYEAAIAGGQFFLISGLLIAFTAINRPSISNGRLMLTGLFWVLAIGSRHFLSAPILFMFILTTFWILGTKDGYAAKTVKLIYLGLPLAVGATGLGWYNWARFGSLTETGFMYALAGVDLQEHSSQIFSGSYIIQNLYNYLFNPPSFMSAFPFVSVLKGAKTLMLPFFTTPNFYYAQPMTGLFYIFPFAVFAVVPLMVFFLKWFNLHHALDLSEGTHNGLLHWLILNLSGSFLIAFLLLMIFFWAGMRYSGDFLPLLTVLSVIGFWEGYQLPRGKSLMKSLYLFSGMILASVSIVMSILLAMSTVYV